MSRPWMRIAAASFISSIFLINFFALILAGVDGDPNNLVPSFEGGVNGVRPAMVLPLFLSHPNSSKQSDDGNFRRQLQKAKRRNPNARMRLYDDLLSNGYYTTRLWIGTPPQEFALIVDTGSSVTYVPCSSCEQCGKHQDPRFDPDLSSTYRPVKCNIDCRCDSEKRVCIYERHYAEMSSSSGVLGEDIISFGNGSELVPQRATFGCENVETGDIYRQRADGIMGLGHGELSIMDQLVDKGVISDSFSLCYGGMEVGGGAMVLGGFSPPSDMVFSYSDPGRSPYYNIELKEIHVSGKPLQLNPSIFEGNHGTIMDSGTTYAYLPEAAFVAFKDAVKKELHSLKQIRGPDPNYNDICFSGAGSDVTQLSKSFPKVDMVFGNGQKLSLAPENYLFQHTKIRGAYCLGIFQTGKDSTTLLGGIIVRNTLVTYDRANQKIGFWKTNCSVLWENLHIPAATLPSAASSSRNSNVGMPPTLAPNALATPFITGQDQVGVIMFDMSLSTKYSDMVPQVKELAKVISQELEVDASQVHLLNFTSKGNESLIRWAIFPAGSAYYISNTTAMSIIVRLTEHRMKLPNTFGNYQLVKWNVEPPIKRSWWKQHFVAVIVGATIILVLCLSTALWIVWRRRQQELGSYKHVGAIVPEQELQQL